MEAGEFDDLPGAGKPLEDLDIVYDPAWWVRKWVRRERARDAADRLRRAVRAEMPSLTLRTDEGARERIAQLNEAIDAINPHLAEGDRIPPMAGH